MTYSIQVWIVFDLQQMNDKNVFSISHVFNLSQVKIQTSLRTKISQGYFSMDLN